MGFERDETLCGKRPENTIPTRTLAFAASNHTFREAKKLVKKHRVSCFAKKKVENGSTAQIKGGRGPM